MSFPQESGITFSWYWFLKYRHKIVKVLLGCWNFSSFFFFLCFEDTLSVQDSIVIVTKLIGLVLFKTKTLTWNLDKQIGDGYLEINNLWLQYSYVMDYLEVMLMIYAVIIRIVNSWLEAFVLSLSLWICNTSLLFLCVS